MCRGVEEQTGLLTLSPSRASASTALFRSKLQPVSASSVQHKYCIVHGGGECATLIRERLREEDVGAKAWNKVGITPYSGSPRWFFWGPRVGGMRKLGFLLSNGPM